MKAHGVLNAMKVTVTKDGRFYALDVRVPTSAPFQPDKLVALVGSPVFVEISGSTVDMFDKTTEVPGPKPTKPKPTVGKGETTDVPKATFDEDLKNTSPVCTHFLGVDHYTDEQFRVVLASRQDKRSKMFRTGAHCRVIGPDGVEYVGAWPGSRNAWAKHRSGAESRALRNVIQWLALKVVALPSFENKSADLEAAITALTALRAKLRAPGPRNKEITVDRAIALLSKAHRMSATAFVPAE